MLPKEEKKSIENFKYWIQTNTERGVCTIPDYICINALNLLDKQQKEIEKLERINKDYDLIYTKQYEYIQDCISKKIIRKKIEEYKHKDFIKMQVVMRHDKEALKIVKVLEELLGYD